MNFRLSYVCSYGISLITLQAFVMAHFSVYSPFKIRSIECIMATEIALVLNKISFDFDFQ